MFFLNKFICVLLLVVNTTQQEGCSASCGEQHPGGHADLSQKTAPSECKNEERIFTDLQRHQLRQNILTGRNEMFMQVWHAPCCGRFVRTLIPFVKDDLVAEYVGDILHSQEEVDEQSARHNHTGHMGYIFEYQWNGKTLWRDPDSEANYGNRMARLFSHGIHSINMESHIIGDDDGIPHVVLVAIKDIAIGDELKYNYGVNTESLKPEDTWATDPEVADAVPEDAQLLRLAFSEAFPNFNFDSPNSDDRLEYHDEL